MKPEHAELLTAWRLEGPSTDKRESLLISCLALGALRKIVRDKWGPLFEGTHIGETSLADSLEPQPTAYGAIPGVLGNSFDVNWALKHLLLVGQRTTRGSSPIIVRLTPVGRVVACWLTADLARCHDCESHDLDLCIEEGSDDGIGGIGCTDCHGMWEPRILALMHLAAQHRATGIWRGITGPH